MLKNYQSWTATRRGSRYEIGADITTDFVGELADVYVLIKQFLVTMPTVWRTEFDTMINFKLRRQIERIESENP